MPRNLRHRVEVLFPIEDPVLRERLRTEVLATYLSDRVKARRILPDGGHERVEALPGEPVVHAQATLLELAARNARRLGEPMDAPSAPDGPAPARRRRRTATSRKGQEQTPPAS